MKTAMILAAGLGSRMGHLTAACPKPLLPLGPYKLIDFTIRKLISAGIQKIVVNTHYLSEMLEDHLIQTWSDQIELKISFEPEILGTGGGIANAERFFNEEPVLFCNSDVLTDLDLSRLIKFHNKSGRKASMVVTPSKDNLNYSLIHYSDKMEMLDILPKGSRLPERGFTGIFTGFQVLSPEARKMLKPSFSSVIDEVYRKLLKKKEPVGILEHTGLWLDIGTRERYEDVQRKVEKGTISLKTIL